MEKPEALAISGYRKLHPTGPRDDPIHARWRIQENPPERVKA